VLPQTAHSGFCLYLLLPGYLSPYGQFAVESLMALGEYSAFPEHRFICVARAAMLLLWNLRPVTLFGGAFILTPLATDALLCCLKSRQSREAVVVHHCWKAVGDPRGGDAVLATAAGCMEVKRLPLPAALLARFCSPLCTEPGISTFPPSTSRDFLWTTCCS
jgi:hypothetical protein